MTWEIIFEGHDWLGRSSKGAIFKVSKQPDLDFSWCYPAVLVAPDQERYIIQNRARELGEAKRFCERVARAYGWE